ncbi:MAG: hypothetical protein SFV81_29305 [Pirellulaceae bacterium]|nr:hypothetical protein [Pirellulaceae bacterium]
MNDLNPYNPPVVSSAAPVTSNWPPAFCIATFVASLLFCFLRLPLLVLELSGDSMGYDPAFEPTIISGIATSAAIIFFGFIGNGLLLGRIAWGIPFGVCLLLSVAASIGVDIWMDVISRSLPGYRSTLVSEAFSFGIPVFRTTLLLLYAAALFAFRSWLLNRRRKF